MGVDEPDGLIITRLMASCRIPFRDLAEELGLSVNAVHRRVHNMIEQGIISEFVAGVQFNVLTTVTAHVRGIAPRAISDEMCEILGRSEFVYGIFVGFGNLVRITCFLRQMSELDAVVDLFSEITGIAAPEVRFMNMPGLDHDANLDSLTRLDFRIVDALRHDARMSIKDLSDELGITAKTTRKHLERMIDESLINLSVGLFSSNFPEVMVVFEVKLDGTGSRSKLREECLGIIAPMGMVFTFANPRDLLLGYVFTTDTEGIRAYQGAIEALEGVEGVMVNRFYRNYQFETWRDDFVRDRARGSGPGP